MEQHETDWETLKGLVPLIKNQQIKEFTMKFLTEHAPEYFKTVPASSSGKYHPKTSLGKGGLVRHTIAATKVLYYILGLDWAKEEFTELQCDQMMSAIILHDTFKQGMPGEEGHTVKDHELIAAKQVNKVLNIPDSQIARMIRTHMGQWGAAHPEALDEFLVHLADYLASRKLIEIDTSKLI